MKPVSIEAIQVHGLVVRTRNVDEMNPETSKIAPLWQQFWQDVAPLLDEQKSQVYGVYYDYESDASGEFNVMAGTDFLTNDNASLKPVTIEKGNYLVFVGKGDMPQTVINTWADIWAYFSADNCEYQRAYTTDFELWKGGDEVHIHIAVK
ncbi:GyrI-like domain-containing protein [Hydrogenovibrio sp. JE_KL2]|uniref:GyrI-like domain-containing protein n=1 Tax=Hydrogenovibrio sp. JE_KL2 TaxID=2651188 RepID=UPI00128AECB2|nr:GyrI-like domain-containing protein [Hydrogenovibrio sp. JE_KL2]MPQ75878.1 GyrI-like domain-containing protein [Hydrogenovibrio sp. JE_KL2]